MIPARKGKPAVTHWRVLAEANGRALVEFRPITGRTHQLRVHSASGIGIPLLGDPVYGGKGAWRTMLELRSSEAAELEIRRMAIAQGMRTLLQEGLSLVESDTTTISEVIRVIYAS